MRTEILIKNGNLVLFDRVTTGDILIKNGTIYAIGGTHEAMQADLEIDAAGKYIIPGFVDIHTHGCNGFDFTNGVFDTTTNTFKKDQDNYLQGLEKAGQYYVDHGTTRVFLATVAASTTDLSNSFSLLDEFLGQCSESTRNQIAGILLEGTFVKNKAYAGAQNPEFFHTPDIDYFKKLQDAALGRIRSVNVTPEFEKPALDLIEYLTENGVVACAGHTGASAIQYEKAIDKGLKVAIHFLNGPTGGSTKPFGHGGAIQAVLRSRDVYAETITDGFHVDPIYVREVLKRKGKTRVMAITDSMFVTGMNDVDTFVVSGIKGKVSDNKQYLEVAGTEDTLFGSVLTMDKAFSNIVSWLTAPMNGMWTESFPAYSFEDAMIQATWMCSRTPAKALNIMRPETLVMGQDLSPYTGSIDVGKSADLLITTMDGECGNYDLNIENVIVKGQLVK